MIVGWGRGLRFNPFVRQDIGSPQKNQYVLSVQGWRDNFSHTRTHSLAPQA